MPQNSQVLITGASSGIGAAYSRRLAQDGYTPILVARRLDRLEIVAKELEEVHGVSAECVALDLSLPAELEELTTRLRASAPLAMLVHCAGFNTPRTFADQSSSSIGQMLSLHAVAGMQLAHAALPGMLRAGRGAIVFISSLGAFFTATGYVPYSATKSFLNMLAEGLSAELAGTGVRAQSVCAGLTRTAFLETADYADFNPYARVPSWVFMSPESVVEEALLALGKNRTIFVPGARNRAFVRAMHTPILGRLLIQAIQKLSPRRPSG